MDKKKHKIKKILDILYELYPEVVKEWIVEQWPHGYGLYD